MREFIEKKSKEPTELTLFGNETMRVDLKSTDCVEEYTFFMMKRVYRQKFGKPFKGSLEVDRKNGNIRIENNDGQSFWSSDTKRNIENFINAVISVKDAELEREQQEKEKKQSFIDDLKSDFPNIEFGEPDTTYDGELEVEATVNGLEITVNSEYEVTYDLPYNKRNMRALLDFFQKNHFDLEDDEDEYD